jgi:hypothetical protein
MRNPVIYIVRDARLGDCCKIGSDSTWPKRLRQAQSHSPGGIDLVAAWRFATAQVQELRTLEQQARNGLKPRLEADGTEWVSAKPMMAVEHVERAFRRPPDLVDMPSSLGRPYDDWRSLKDDINGIIYRRRIWVFEEQSSQRRVKIIHSIHFDGFYYYAFTWNPYKVRLRAAFEAPLDFGGPDVRWTPSNARMVSVWAETLRRFGADPDQRCCGWLPEGVRLISVLEFLSKQGLRAYDLDQPKRADTPPKDHGLSAALSIGTRPPQNRVIVGSF